jgi:hypothetical protein
MRTEARAGSRARRSSSRELFETPEWLDHSFVLPLTRPEVTAMPAQPLPDHDDLGDSGDLVDGAHDDSPCFVRPPSKEVDFARVIKRAEGERLAGRAAAVSTGVTGLAVIGYLITGATPVLVVLLVAAVVSILALVLGRLLSAAPIPHLDA